MRVTFYLDPQHAIFSESPFVTSVFPLPVFPTGRRPLVTRSRSSNKPSGTAHILPDYISGCQPYTQCYEVLAGVAGDCQLAEWLDHRLWVGLGLVYDDCRRRFENIIVGIMLASSTAQPLSSFGTALCAHQCTMYVVLCFMCSIAGSQSGSAFPRLYWAKKLSVACPGGHIYYLNRTHSKQ